MTRVKLEKELAMNLIMSKLNILKQHIDQLLARYNESSSKEFVEKARTGVYANAEDDAVELRQFISEYSKLQKILKNINKANNK